MEIPPSVVDALVAASRNGIVGALSEPAVINALLEVHVRQLVLAGDLVPRERLRVGAAVELGPFGLESAARALLDAARDVELPDELRDAFKALGVVLEPEAHQDEPEAEAEPDPAAATTCTKCGEGVTTEQALISNTRWGEVLCLPCHSAKGEEREKEREKGKTT